MEDICNSMWMWDSNSGWHLNHLVLEMSNLGISTWFTYTICWQWWFLRIDLSSNCNSNNNRFYYYLVSYVWFLSHPSKCFPNLGPLPTDHLGASSWLLVLAGYFYRYAPGPTITGVDTNGWSAELPGKSLLYPKENLLEFGTSGLIPGSY